MTRRLLLAAGLTAALAPVATAGLLPGVVSRTADAGHTRYGYDVVLPTDTQLRAGNYFTIYDFAGYVPGTAAAPSGWTFSLANVGPTPVQTAPADDPAVPNLSWAYTGAGLAGPAAPGTFSAASTFVDVTAAYFTARTQTLSGAADTNITTTLVPVGQTATAGPTVPEPATLLLAGLGLAGVLGRRASRA